jgi:hypothetical protein
MLFTNRCVHRGEGIPKKILVVLMPEEQYHNTIETNQFQFGHQNMSEIMVSCDERQYPYSGGYKTNFTTHDYNEAYLQLMEDCGPNVDIDLSAYDDGFCMYSFNLTESGAFEEDVISPRRSGEVFLSFTLRNNPPTNLVVLAILERDRVLTIDKNRNFEDKMA